MFKKLKAWWQKRQHKKRWPDEYCLERARIYIRQDAQWMSHDPVAKAIYERVGNLIAENWMKNPHEEVSSFRERIGLTPDYSKKP